MNVVISQHSSDQPRKADVRLPPLAGQAGAPCPGECSMSDWAAAVKLKSRTPQARPNGPSGRRDGPTGLDPATPTDNTTSAKPMKILSRYILIELTKWFLISLTALTLIMVIFGVMREALDRGLPPAQVVMLIPYVLPEALRFSIPGTLLLAATSVFGRMSSSNEIVAIKSMGISPISILWPMWALAFVLSLVTVYLNDAAVSWGRNGVQRVVVNAAEDIAYGMLRTQKRYKSPDFFISVKRVEGKKLIRPHVWIQGHGNSPTVTITAEEGELRTDLENNILVISMRNGSFETTDGKKKFSMDFPNTMDREIPLDAVSRAGAISNNPSQMRVGEITKEVAQQKAKIERMENKMAARAANQMLGGDFDGLANKEWKTREQWLDEANSRLCRLQTVPWRRWADGFCCLCFAWVGAPMAIRRRNQDFLTSFFLCFLPILVVYYPLMAWGVNGAKHGELPVYSVWAGNILLLIWGAYLLRKVVRY